MPPNVGSLCDRKGWNERDLQHERSLADRRYDEEFTERQLYTMKETEWSSYNIHEMPFPGLCCRECITSTKKCELTQGYLRDILDSQQICSANGLKSFYFPNLRLWFSLSPTSNRPITFEQEYSTSSKTGKGTQLVTRTIKVSSWLTKFGTFLLHWILRRCCNSITFNQEQLRLVGTVKSTGSSTIYLPVYRSRLDQVILCALFPSFNGIDSPFSFVPDDKRMPVLGCLLQRMGVVYYGRNECYPKSYYCGVISKVINRGEDVSIAMDPKFESIFLKYVLDGYTTEFDNASIVPINITYEKLLEDYLTDNEFAKLNFWKRCVFIYKLLFKMELGEVQINIHQPFSLQEIMTSLKNKNFVKLRNLNDDESERFQLSLLKDHLTYDCAKSQVIMSTNVVSFLLLFDHKGEAVPLLQLQSEVPKLCELLAAKENRFQTNRGKINVNYVIDLMGPELVIKTVGDDGQIELHPQSHNLISLRKLYDWSFVIVDQFMLKAVVVSSIHALIKKDLKSALTSVQGDLAVYHNYLTTYALKLCDILREEFQFAKPCSDLETNINEVIMDLVTGEVLYRREACRTEEEEFALRAAKRLDMEDTDEDEDDEYGSYYYKQEDSYPPIFKFTPLPTRKGYMYYLTNDEKTWELIAYYRKFVKPYIDVYAFLARYLIEIFHDDYEVPDSQLIPVLIDKLEEQFESGSISGECISEKTIRNAMKLFEHWGRVEIIHPAEEAKYLDVLYDVPTELDDELYLREAVQEIQLFVDISV